MIEDLLKKAYAEHVRAVSLRRSGSHDEARVALSNARDLRLQAIAADPEQNDPAWKNERVPHAQMLAFYALQLGE